MRLSILGSTGSIGVQTLECVDNLPGFSVAALTAHSNIDLLEAQAWKYRPEAVVATGAGAARELERRLAGSGIRVLEGIEGVISCAEAPSADMVVNALVGSVGLRPTVAAIQAGKALALANKETLVAGGELVTGLAARHNVEIRPIDSEHSAIFQCMRGNEAASVSKIYLTASGGPFRGKSRRELESVTPADALKHPNWSMGAKITVDSATMMNKGLEVIEAKWLFGLPPGRIDVLVHPQSVIHSMVEFQDGAVMAQLGEPDMRVPISYALTYPRRARTDFPKIDFLMKNSLTFEKPDLGAFPCLGLAFEAIGAGGNIPAVMNAANEAAVGLFLEGKISFTQIPRLIEKAMGAYNVDGIGAEPNLAAILDADGWGRRFVFNEVRACR